MKAIRERYAKIRCFHPRTGRRKDLLWGNPSQKGKPPSTPAYVAYHERRRATFERINAAPIPKMKTCILASLVASAAAFAPAAGVRLLAVSDLFRRLRFRREMACRLRGSGLGPSIAHSQPIPGKGWVAGLPAMVTVADCGNSYR